ncbi:glycine cleavage system protein GcvH [Pseudomonadota bacterium]
MSEAPANLKYTKSHEWVEVQEDGTVKVGITDHAQELLGDMVYVEVPEVDAAVSAGEECAVVESVKAASDIYSPVTGEVVAVNEDLADTPDLVNNHPYGDGWIMQVRMTEEGELDEMMDADAYVESVTEEE